MHVDGFRFDLATILAREPNGFDKQQRLPRKSARRIRCSSSVKLIAEPWDCGPGGYQVGEFPPGWAEWNDKYRDTVRDYWTRRRRSAASSRRGLRLGRHLQPPRPQTVGERQLHHRARRLHAATTSCRYNEQHNEANGEDNRDGHSNNRSWNCGAEGADRRSGDHRAARAAEAQHPRDAAVLAGHADAAGRRRVRRARSKATTTPTARTTRSAGSTGRCRRGTQALVRFVQQLTALRAQVSDPASQPLPVRRR